ncbi:retrovirus-related pol polyprotein from transposon TNT 1-94 [Tanacetum coccineum]
MTGQRSQLINFVDKFMGAVRSGNDQIAKIMGYGDYQLGNVTISKVYYVEGLDHKLFFVGQLCDSDLEVAFRKHACFVQNIEGAYLLSRSRDTNLYTISLDDMLKSSTICLLSKASKTKSWLWHRRLSHLNLGKARSILINQKLKTPFKKNCIYCTWIFADQCVSRVSMGKSTSWFSLMIIQGSHRNIRTDNGTKFSNQTLKSFYKNVRISHQTSITRTPQQNGVVERQNRTLVEAACTMLIFSKALLYLWAEAVSTTCRIGFARVLVEISSKKELKKDVIMAIPNEDGTSHTMVVISVEYEWQPPRCAYCKIFCHSLDKCPKIIREPVISITDTNSDGFTEVKGKKDKGKKVDIQPRKKGKIRRGVDMDTLTKVGTNVINKSDDEVDEFLFPEGDKLGNKFDIRLKGSGQTEPKADIGIFVGYAPTKKAYRIYNRLSRMIMETIHVDFDELTAMASEEFSSGPAP